MPSSVVGASGDPDIDGLLHGRKWLDGTAFSFPDAAADYAGTAAEADSGFAQISPRQQQLLRFLYDGTTPAEPNLLRAMSVADFTNLKLGFAGYDGAEMRAGQSSVPPRAYASFPGQYAAAGDVWFGTASGGIANDFRNPVLGNYAYLTHVHEALHSPGLKHGNETQYGITGITVTPARNSLEYSVVNGVGYLGRPTAGYGFETWGAPQTPMLLDVQALQYLYGANYAYNGGNTTYAWSPATGELSINGVAQGRPGGNKVFMTLWDGGGVDTYDLSNYGVGVVVNLGPGDWSTFGGGQLAYLGDGRYAAGNVCNAFMHGGNPASLIEAAVGGPGNDTFVGNHAGNVFSGNAGDDAFYDSAGNDAYSGGAGYDVLDASRSGFRGAAGSKVLGARGDLGFRTGGGYESVSGVEKVLFADGALHTSPDSHAAQVQRMYLAGLGRGSDQAGQTGWTDALDRGAPLKQLAEGLVRSAEFQARFGGPDAPVGSYVAQLYRGVLGRDGGDAERAFWTEQLASGRADRADALVTFSEGAEHRAATAGAVAAGVWVMDADAPAVARMYDTVLGRQPDELGLKTWCDRLGAGDVTLKGMAAQLVQGQEFLARFGALGDGDFVDVLYANALGRAADAAGKAGWVGALQNRVLDRADVAVACSESAEHQDLTRDLNLAADAARFGIAFA